MSNPPVFITADLTLDHYRQAFRVWNAWPFIKNSLIISISTTLVILFLGVPAAYAVSKYRAGGIKFQVWLVLQRMLPPVVIVIPLYLIFSKIGLLDTYVGMVLPYHHIPCTFCHIDAYRFLLLIFHHPYKKQQWWTDAPRCKPYEKLFYR